MSNADSDTPQAVDDLEDLLGYQLRRASAAVMAHLSAELAECELTPAEASALLIVAGAPEIAQSDLGRRLGIHRANMTPLAASLESRGWLKRRPIDGRTHGLTLTAAGKKLAAKARRRIEAHEAAFFGHLNPNVRAQLIDWLRDVRARAATR